MSMSYKRKNTMKKFKSSKISKTKKSATRKNKKHSIIKKITKRRIYRGGYHWWEGPTVKKYANDPEFQNRLVYYFDDGAFFENPEYTLQYLKSQSKNYKSIEELSILIGYKLRAETNLNQIKRSVNAMRYISRTEKEEINTLERPEREKKAREKKEEEKKEKEKKLAQLAKDLKETYINENQRQKTIEEKKLAQLAKDLKETYINENQRQKTIEENQKRRDRARERNFTIRAIREHEKQKKWQQEALLRKKQIETENKRAQTEASSTEREIAQQNQSHTTPTEEILDPYWCHKNRYDFNGSYVSHNPKGIYDEKGNILHNCHIVNTTTL